MVDESSKDDLKSQAAPNLASGLSYAYDKPDESTKVRVHYNPPPFQVKEILQWMFYRVDILLAV